MLRIQVVLSLLIPAFFTNGIVSLESFRPITKPDQRVRCTIWTDRPLLLRGGPAIVHFSLENTSPENILIIAMTGHLRLKQKSESSSWNRRQQWYWSPVNLETKSALKPVPNASGGWSYPETSFTLKANGEFEFIIDLSTLEWANQLSAGLPSVGLYGAVPKGRYELHFDVGAHDSIDSAACNGIDIEIESIHDQRHKMSQD